MPNFAIRSEHLGKRYRLGSPAALAPIGVRQVLLHGAKDETVPVSISVEYHARATALGDDVRLITLPGADHFEVINPLAPEWLQSSTRCKCARR